ncbi:hypothetical protein D3C87_1350960 [compost metagenome]
MQLTGEVSALFFAHLLQMVGQLRQRGGAVAHQAFQAIALAFQQRLLPMIHGLQRLRLAQVHVERQQTDGRDRGNTDARQHERLLDLLLAKLDPLVTARDELQRVLANRFHVLLAHVRVQDELPRIFIALPAQTQAQLHFGELARDLARQKSELLHVVWRVHELVAQAVQIGLHRGHSLVVWLQIGFVARKQITALARFCVQHALQQRIDGAARALAMCHLLDGVLRTHVAGFVDTDQNHRCKQRHRQAQRHLADLWQPTPGVFFEVHTLILDNG